MHDLAFAEAARQTPITILRLAMRPYSIGHELLLLNHRNPLVYDQTLLDQVPPPVKRAALMKAALICHRSWNEIKRPEKFLGFWAWLTLGTDIEKEIEVFRAYREVGSDCPPAPSQENYEIANGLQSEDPGRALGGSYLARLLLFAGEHHTAFGYETPYDFPLGFALHLYHTHLEMEGSVRIENERELQVRLEMDEHRAAIAAERAGEEAAACQP